MAERRRQGLCYNCDEPYVCGHKCQHLFYLEVTDFIDEAPNLLDDPPAAAEEEPLITFHTITGILTEDTMHLQISVGSFELTALLNSVAQRIGLHFQDSRSAHVVVANGDHVTCRVVARDVAICIGGEPFTIDC